MAKRQKAEPRPPIGARVVWIYGRKEYIDYGEIGVVVAHRGVTMFDVQTDDEQPYHRWAFGAKAPRTLPGRGRLLTNMTTGQCRTLAAVHRTNARRFKDVARQLEAAARDEESRLADVAQPTPTNHEARGIPTEGASDRASADREDAEQTYWNGLPTPARRGSAVVADAPKFPGYWARELIGQRIEVVEVILDYVAFDGGIDYLDDRDGSGWRKVTEGRGGPGFGHASLDIEPGSFIALEEQP